ncbi:hypothetical protein [Kordiimonas laminariae]|uniref:hypothetical protein n=1 Tax=Kordiimonas laminariae TaxID=2917717 RepID=UPI001FF5D525|nr:hypothetical protein [Kordiimonas laminariae]MCK0067986.1 hypothetical protein [Kordiimonas laminariae]
MAKPRLFIFGELAPISTVAAGYTAQTALFMSQYADVTIVIADHAPVPLPVPAKITVKRHRDLSQLTKPEQTAARLFIIGDSAQSLDTLKLYEQFPGEILVPTKSLYRLFISHLKTKTGWPFTYTKWLHQCFGDQAEIIAQALLRQGRESSAIADEVPLELIFPNIYQHRLSLPEFAPGLPTCFYDSIAASSMPSPKDRGVTSVLVIGPKEGAEAAIKNLNELGHHTECQIVHGSDTNVSEYIYSSDIVFISEHDRDAPAYLPIALLSGKPLITSGQRWARYIAAPSFNMPHASAAQHLTAALGAIIAKPEIHNWLRDYNKHLAKSIKGLNFTSCVNRILKRSDIALEIKPNQQTEPIAPIKESHSILSVNEQVALIGAVPPKAILSNAFPELDIVNSPKFATEDLCKTLQLYSASPLPILLSQMGYEAPIISTSSSQNHHTVSKILAELKHADKAISFGPVVQDAESANGHVSHHLTKARSSISVLFPSAIKEDNVSGYEPLSGLLWQRDPIRDVVSCVFILGLPGIYQLSLNSTGRLTISTSTATHRLTQKTPLRLETDSTGVLFFTLSIENNAKNQESCSEILTKSLADYPLNLEWLDHE